MTDAERTRRAVAAAASEVLRGAEAPRKLIALSQATHRHMDHVIAPATTGAACRAGCDLCCHIPPPISPIEAIELAHHVRENFSKEERASLEERICAYRSAWDAHAADVRFRHPCPLLVNHQCSAYQARPMACRTYHSFSLAACQRDFADPIGAEVPQDPRAEAEVMPILEGLSQAAESVGADFGPVLLAFALEVALGQEDAAGRWLSGDNPLRAAQLDGEFVGQGSSYELGP